MFIGNDFTKVEKDGVWYVYNRYTVSLEPDFVGETEEECDRFIEEEYRVGEQIEDEMMKWL